MRIREDNEGDAGKPASSNPARPSKGGWENGVRWRGRGLEKGWKTEVEDQTS